MRIAVTGANGQLGSELCRQIGDDAIPLNRPDFDLMRGDEVIQTLCELRPDAVINAAAYTNVDRAESEPELCFQVNAEGVDHVVEACRQLDCPLVQLSTDYVFGADTSRVEPYRETDPSGPINVYGHSKLQGEQNAAACTKHYIIRTCGLYGNPDTSRPPRNFVEKILSLAQDRSELQVVADQFCTPSYVPHIAEAILSLLQTDAYGTYHVTNTGATTWHEFAAEVFASLTIRSTSPRARPPFSTHLPIAQPLASWTRQDTTTIPVPKCPTGAMPLWRV